MNHGDIVWLTKGSEPEKRVFDRCHDEEPHRYCYLVCDGNIYRSTMVRLRDVAASESVALRAIVAREEKALEKKRRAIDAKKARIAELENA